MKFRLIDLFCGAGGMTLGFVDKEFCGGFESVLAIDRDESAIKSHSENFGGRNVACNIEEWLQSDPSVPQADVVIGALLVSRL